MEKKTFSAKFEKFIKELDFEWIDSSMYTFLSIETAQILCVVISYKLHRHALSNKTRESII